MRYGSEIEVKDALGLPDWRHLRKEHFLQLLSMVPDMDTEVAFKVIGQIPEMTGLARAALDDAARAFDAALGSNTRSMEMVHEVQTERMALLRAGLGREDLSPTERMQLFDQVRDVHELALAKDTENKRFVSEQLEKRLWVGFAGVATVAVTVFAAAKSGGKRPFLGKVA
jgi:hypothetical protein